MYFKIIIMFTGETAVCANWTLSQTNDQRIDVLITISWVYIVNVIKKN